MNAFEVGGVGSVACQMAKNAYRAGKVITTVSTEKAGKVDKLLGNGVVDQSLSEMSIGIMLTADTYSKLLITRKVTCSQTSPTVLWISSSIQPIHPCIL